MTRTTFSAALVTICCALAGCGSTPQAPAAAAAQVQYVNVAVPVACAEPVPARPAMDTETLPPDSAIDVQSRAMRAEIERREGYEGQLRTALDNCRRPITP